MASNRQRGNGQGSLYQRDGRGAWVAKWYDHNGRRQERSTKTTDKRAALRFLSKWATEANMRRDGVVDARAEALTEHGRRPLADHLADFKAALLAGGTTAKHAELVFQRASKALNGADCSRWAETSGSRVADYLRALRSDREIKNEAGELIRTKAGISAQTFNFYLGAVKQFGRWMVKDRRAADNPFAYLSPLNVKTDRRHDRRAMSPDELRGLISAAESGPERFGMSGPQRATMYRLAVETGLRAGELRSLTRAGFNFEGERPTVTVGAAYSKRRREDTLPLRPETAAHLKGFLAGMLPTLPVFRMPDPDDLADMLRGDLAEAGIEYRDEAGRVVDFHALRHTFISNLAAGGVHPKTAQALARHSTISLTMDRYTHQWKGDEAAALSVLPDLRIPAVGVLEANGTDHATPLSIDPTSRPTSSSGERRVLGGTGRNEAAVNSQVEAVHRGLQNYCGALTLRDSTGFGGTQQSTEAEGFEPPEHLRVQRFSKPSPSAARARLRVAGLGRRIVAVYCTAWAWLVATFVRRSADGRRTHSFDHPGDGGAADGPATAGFARFRRAHRGQ